jgi:DNA-binding Lrp family transcriptional regulator
MDAYVFLRTEPNAARDVGERLAARAGEGIRQAAVITGEWDVVVAIEVEDPHALGDVVLSQIAGDEAVLETHTVVAVPMPDPETNAPPKPMPTRGMDRFFALVMAKVDAALAREHPRGWRSWADGLADAIHDVPGVFAGTLITGEWDLLVEVGGESWEACAAAIVELAALPGFTATSTAVGVSPKLAAAAE